MSRTIFIIGENHLKKDETEIKLRKLINVFDPTSRVPRIFGESTIQIPFLINSLTNEKVYSQPIPKIPSMIEAIFHIFAIFIFLRTEPNSILKWNGDEDSIYSHTPDMRIHILMKRILDIDISPKSIVKRSSSAFLLCKEKLVELCEIVGCPICKYIIREIKDITYSNINNDNLTPILFESYKLVDDEIINNVNKDDDILNKNNIFYIIVGYDHVKNINNKLKSLTDRNYMVTVI